MAAKRKAPQPSYDDDGDINNSSSTSSSTSSSNNSDEDVTTPLRLPHKKSKKELLVGGVCASTNKLLSSSSSSVQQHSDDRQEHQDTAAAAAAVGGIPTKNISTLQLARQANEDNAQDVIRNRNDNNNAFLKMTRKEKINKSAAVLSKNGDIIDNATTKLLSPACTVPSSLMNGSSSTKHASSVGRGNIGKTVLYFSLFLLNITTLIIASIVIIGLSSTSYDTLNNQYMGRAQQIESSILQSRQEELLLQSNLHKLEQEMQIILQRNIVMEEIDFIEQIMDGGDTTTATTAIRSLEEKGAWIESMRILDVEKSRVMNIWNTNLDEIKNIIYRPTDDEDTSTTQVVISDEITLQMDAHTAGRIGNISALNAIATKDIMLLKVFDNNGWTPLHEAARSGHLEAVQFLIDHGGLNKNERTNSGRGGTPIWWARNNNGDEHPVVQYLESIKAVDISPE